MFFNWKTACIIFQIIEPLIARLIYWGVPKSKIKLYENIAKYIQPAINSLFKLKEKVKQSPNSLDNTCLKQGISIVRKTAQWMIEQADELEKDI